MKRVLQTFLFSLNLGPRLLLLAFALGFPVAMAGHYTHSFECYPWLTFSPGLVWKGQVWRLLTYAFLPIGFLDWLISLFWLATLVCVLARHWTGRDLWIYCMLSALASSVSLTLLKQPHFEIGGNGAMILALTAAWVRLYGHERIILLGFGEMSVRQAALVVAIVEVLILFFSFGMIVTLAMVGGGLTGWCYLFLRGNHGMNRRGQILGSERIARLEI